MVILLASGNRHKQREIQEVLSAHEIVTPFDLGMTFEYDETGTTFLENALGKALHLRAMVDTPVLADDSGLMVPALGGEPGIRSARYGDDLESPPVSDEDRYRLLLGNMDQIEDRRASFVCCMVLCVDDLTHFSVQERFDGEIARAPSGTAGFGYDPVFYVPDEGTTVAEISPERKNEISHRGKALRRLLPLLESLQ